MPKLKDYDPDVTVKDFHALVEDAERNADNDWECEFVSSMAERLEKYGAELWLTDKQIDKLRQIARRDEAE